MQVFWKVKHQKRGDDIRRNGVTHPGPFDQFVVEGREQVSQNETGQGTVASKDKSFFRPATFPADGEERNKRAGSRRSSHRVGERDEGGN